MLFVVQFRILVVLHIFQNMYSRDCSIQSTQKRMVWLTLTNISAASICFELVLLMTGSSVRNWNIFWTP